MAVVLDGVVASPAVAAVAGALAGGAIVAALAVALRRRAARELGELLARHEQTLGQREDVAREHLRAVVEAASRDALLSSPKTFLELASTRLEQQTQKGEAVLDGKRAANGSELGRLTEHLGRVEQMMAGLERERQRHFGELSRALEESTTRSRSLEQTTDELRRALASPKARGQWGEWMAENVLAMLGLTEGVDYLRQATVEGAGTRPDFTFLLPKGLSVNMDVKFPFDNYWQWLSADDAAAGERAAKAFVADVRRRIGEVTTRDYIDPRGGTVDYVLVFIPNERVFAFLHERAPELVGEAFARKVILCSPYTLYGLLAVIRQAVGVFALEQRSKDVLGALADFRRAWEAFQGGLDKLDRRFADAATELRRLRETRRTRVERALDAVDELRVADEPSNRERA